MKLSKEDKVQAALGLKFKCVECETVKNEDEMWSLKISTIYGLGPLCKNCIREKYDD